jgi:hypothetical protein
MAGRSKGGPKTGGRQKGTPNKTTALLKDAILLAAENAHEDGLVGYLTSQAVANPTSFMTLLGKVLPTQISGDPDNPIEFVNLDTPTRARALAAFVAKTKQK